MAKITPDHSSFLYVKLGCVVRMVVESILPHAECGLNDHRKDAPPFMRNRYFYQHAKKLAGFPETVAKKRSCGHPNLALL